jgi:prepilin-type N-terminal cleavage/methylation domain-containing protein
MRAGARREPRRGFTAVELIAALAILALASSLGAVGFRRHARSARAAEANSMLVELASKEQAFRARSGGYAPLRADGRGQLPSVDEDADAYYPQPADSPSLASARNATLIGDRELWPPAWRALAVRPPTELAYCTYLLNAGDGGRPDPALRYGAQLLPSPVTGPWFYALAVCNLEGSPRYPGGVTVYGLSSENLTVRVLEDER